MKRTARKRREMAAVGDLESEGLERLAMAKRELFFFATTNAGGKVTTKHCVRVLFTESGERA